MRPRGATGGWSRRPSSRHRRRRLGVARDRRGDRSPTTTCIPRTAATASAMCCSTPSSAERRVSRAAAGRGRPRHLVVWSEDKDVVPPATRWSARGFRRSHDSTSRWPSALTMRSPQPRVAEGIVSRAFPRSAMDERGLSTRSIMEAFAEHFLFGLGTLEEWQLAISRGPTRTRRCGASPGTATGWSDSSSPPTRDEGASSTTSPCASRGEAEASGALSRRRVRGAAGARPDRSRACTWTRRTSPTLCACTRRRACTWRAASTSCRRSSAADEEGRGR